MRFLQSLKELTFVPRSLLTKTVNPKLFRGAYIDHSLRPMTIFLRQHFKNEPVEGVEVGVFAGGHVARLMEHLNVTKMILVDPYIPYVEYGKIIDPRQGEKILKWILKPYLDKLYLIKEPSQVAARFIPNNQSFVYIDGNHEEKSVATDIELFWDKVKVGGVLGGHDYNSLFKGVTKAVNNFVKKHKLKLQHNFSDWWFIKP